MRIIVESGATKSDWRVFDSDGHQTSSFILPGMNVSSMKIDEVESILLNLHYSYCSVTKELNGSA